MFLIISKRTIFNDITINGHNYKIIDVELIAFFFLNYPMWWYLWYNNHYLTTTSLTWNTFFKYYRITTIQNNDRTLFIIFIYNFYWHETCCILTIQNNDI